MSKPLVADKETNGMFYYADEVSGTFFVSSDNGAVFKPSASKFPKCDRVVLAMGNASGTVYMALGSQGLWLTRDFGTTFHQFPSFEVPLC